MKNAPLFTMFMVVLAAFASPLFAQDATTGGEQSTVQLLGDPRSIAAIVAAIIVALSGWVGLILNGRWNRQESNAAREFQRKESEAAREFQQREIEAARKFERAQTKATQEFQRQESAAARLFEGLRYFEKGTQTRSIGLALIESNWDLASGRHAMWVAVLSNVAVYLLHEKEDLAAHEIANLHRVRKLLEHGKDLLDDDHKAQIASALAATKHEMTKKERESWSELVSKGGSST